MGQIKAMGVRSPVRVPYLQVIAAGSAPDTFAFPNPAGSGEEYEIIEVLYVYDVAGGASAALDLRVVPSGSAMAGTGVSALAAALDLTATARIPRRAVLSATKANRFLLQGQSLAWDTSGTLTGLAGLSAWATIQPIRGQRKR